MRTRMIQLPMGSRFSAVGCGGNSIPREVMRVLQSRANASCLQAHGFSISDRVSAAAIQEVMGKERHWMIMNRVSGLSMGRPPCHMEENWDLAREKTSLMTIQVDILWFFLSECTYVIRKLVTVVRCRCCWILLNHVLKQHHVMNKFLMSFFLSAEVSDQNFADDEAEVNAESSKLFKKRRLSSTST
jgi:hypothetical protein